MRILVADDESVSRRMLTHLLEKAGYEVLAVADGRVAAELICRQDGPRLALLDWMMPGLDGPGVCREVRKRRIHPYVHIILLTAKNSKADIVEGLESGADDYLVKPFNPAELRARLRTGRRILDLEDNLVEARESMRFKATHDDLTALLNRGAIIELLGRELCRTRRENGCTVLLLGDLDHFKVVNDTYGHVTGDEVLREVARRLLASVRSYDFVGRYGGEEFLVVLNNCDIKRAAERAEELRLAIAKSAVRTLGGSIPITMSVGVFASQQCDALSPEDVLRQVDAALYAAKSAGRNCCYLASAAAVCLSRA